jgi:hypothetical protein
MNPDTLQRIVAMFARHPCMWAGAGASAQELDCAAQTLGVRLPDDYRDFVMRFGGGHAGSLPVAGLREWETAGVGEWSVIQLTERCRLEGWPGTEAWAVISNDGFGNPIGLDSWGRVWLSDHDARECVCLESSFDNWVRRWALHLETPGEYIERFAWA